MKACGAALLALAIGCFVGCGTPPAVRKLSAEQVKTQLSYEQSLKAYFEVINRFADAQVAAANFRIDRITADLQSEYNASALDKVVTATDNAARKKALGSGHPHVATDLNNLAVLPDAKGDYAGAEPLHRRALAIDEKALGSGHPKVATDLNNLALLLRAKGDYASAEPLYRRALAIDEKALGPEHPTTRQIRTNLAELLASTSKEM